MLAIAAIGLFLVLWLVVLPLGELLLLLRKRESHVRPYPKTELEREAYVAQELALLYRDPLLPKSTERSLYDRVLHLLHLRRLDQTLG